MTADQSEPSNGVALASDADRDAVVEVLKERVADGTLTLDEFAHRVDRALTSRTRAELDALVVDLRVPAARSGMARRAPRRHVLSIMSGSAIKGRWRCGREVSAIAVMGGCLIDFRGAEITSDVVYVSALAVMGGVDIVVPEGIEVTMTGLSIMGGRKLHVKDVPVMPGSPRIVVRALPIMGGVTVRSRPRKDAAPVGAPPAAATTPIDAPAPVVDTMPTDRTVTIMFSDVCDYSGMTERLGDTAAHAVLREHNAILRTHIATHEGHEVKSSGDGFMVAFPSAVRAIRCATALQRDLAARNAASGTVPIHVHIGVHAGEVIREGDDYLGTAVITASRLADAAGKDEILVSPVVRELIRGSREFEFDPPRSVLLKGFVDPHEAYAVQWQPS